MSKRDAAEEALEGPPFKKPPTDDLLRQGSGSLTSTTNSSKDNDDGDDDFTTAQTPSSMADADTPATVATTPRAKFPSDLKTLACTWPGCPKTFNRPARLRDHLNSHTNSRPFKCPYDDCEKDYIEDKHLKQHIKAAHTNERKYVCQVEGCGKSFVTGTRLKRHQAVHEGAERFRCQDCGQSFRKRETLTKHVRKEHMQVRAYACLEQDCTESFDSKPALKRHHQKVHGDIKFWCGECGMQKAPDGTEQRVGFTTELLLHAHLKKEHQNCLFCDFKSTSRWELDQHVDMHHSGKTVKDRKTHACAHTGCSKKFTKNSNLRAHIRTAHEGFRFICGQVSLVGPDFEAWTNDQGCGDKFSTKVRLEDHIRFIHLGHERPKLSKPESSNNNPSSLIDELTGVANIVKQTIFCTECNEGFTRYHDLQVHLEKGHDSQDTADDPASFLHGMSAAGEVEQQPLFGQDFNGFSWSGVVGQDDTFATQIDYDSQKDGWLDNETNIMLLAGDPSHDMDLNIDPTLAGL
ncbi:hypothetical protein QQS21_002640 [Conoideocrella luteorostrata]|uniref:C2H2-type domain-containing protein n=1 Tax=Conoideocrella luteorostrata TaxID=1105319 RepID=A0AAJ0CVM7_9HYPO|nr:hypothetical protein QQS21_002640 [Conoideocrella luteorostrata]